MKEQINELNKLLLKLLSEWKKKKQDSPAFKQLSKALTKLNYPALALVDLLQFRDPNFTFNSQFANATYAKVDELESEKKEHLRHEEYEEAAILRDKIRSHYQQLAGKIANSLNFESGFNFYKDTFLLVNPNYNDITEIMHLLNEQGYLQKRKAKAMGKIS